MSNIVQELCGFCHTPWPDRINYGDYIEQIISLLLFKSSNEHGEGAKA